ncbi:MAG: hypothetical protein ACP5NU_03590 [Methanomicrobiales archaeon]
MADPNHRPASPRNPGEKIGYLGVVEIREGNGCRAGEREGLGRSSGSPLLSRVVPLQDVSPSADQSLNTHCQGYESYQW